MKKLCYIFLLISVFLVGCSSIDKASESSNSDSAKSSKFSQASSVSEDEDLLLDTMPDASDLSGGDFVTLTRRAYDTQDTYSKDSNISDEELCPGVSTASYVELPYAFVIGAFLANDSEPGETIRYSFYLRSFETESDAKKWFNIAVDTMKECEGIEVEDTLETQIYKFEEESVSSDADQSYLYSTESFVRSSKHTTKYSVTARLGRFILEVETPDADFSEKEVQQLIKELKENI